ncbi:MAG: GCN5 family acetyltransferase [Rectinemataceae bacterium]
MSIEIRKVSNNKELKAFVVFPETLYVDNPYWVPSPIFDEMNTLRKNKNPAFDFCEGEYWTAWKDGRMVGRVAGIVNRHYIEKWGNKYARFGWLDFIEDFEVAKALMETVEAWARSKGLEAIQGPLGFTDLDREGLLVEGFEERSTMATIYNHPYYVDYLDRLGYAKDVDWIEFLLQVPDSIPEKVLRVNEILSKRSGLQLYDWKKPKDLIARFGEQIFGLLDEAYKELYGTVPLSERQVKSYIDQYLGFVDPRFTKILVDGSGKLAAFALTIPSLAEALQKSKGRMFPIGWIRMLRALKKPVVMDMLLVAVRPEFKSRGVVALLMTALTQSAIDNGVKYAESNPELETNIAVQGLWKDYPKRQHKRRRAYIKKL